MLDAKKEQEKNISNISGEIKKTVGKKNMLKSMSTDLLQKNVDLFLKHETMLEEEREERSKLANNF